MERITRGVGFWILLLISVVLPASAQTTKKVAYRAQITVLNGSGNQSGVGNSLITVSTAGTEYSALTHQYPDFSVTKVHLTPQAGSGFGDWVVVLCENGTAYGDCTYVQELEEGRPPVGNLDIEGQIVPLMLAPIGANAGRIFSDTLRANKLTIVLNDGAKGAGTFVRVL